MSYLIFDIETVPDKKVWAPPSTEETTPAVVASNGTLPGTTEPPAPPKRRSRKRTEDPFAPLYAHSPVAIGYVWLYDNLDVQAMGVVGASSFPNETELLRAWSTFVGQNVPTLVSYNGRGFDLPVLSLRALRFGVPFAWNNKEVRHRYGEAHIDLFDQVIEHGAIQKAGFSLDTMAVLIGLPGKGEMDGSKIASLIANGEAKKVEAYCQADCAKTAFLFMRYMLLRGRITLEEYRKAATTLLNTCGAQSMHGIVFGADTKLLLLEA